MRWIDLLIVAVYMIAMVWIGKRFERKQTSTDAYFVAGRSIPAWALGMSIIATLVSGVGFHETPIVTVCAPLARTSEALGRTLSLPVSGPLSLTPAISYLAPTDRSFPKFLSRTYAFENGSRQSNRRDDRTESCGGATAPDT